MTQASRRGCDSVHREGRGEAEQLKCVDIYDFRAFKIPVTSVLGLN